MSADGDVLPIALTISGAVALGAYEGGVLAGVLRALQPFYSGPEPRVRIDAIGGASAGSITGLLAARCLVKGIPAFEVMKQAWVLHATFGEMQGTDLRSPLSVEPLEQLAYDLITRPGDPANAQPTPVRISMALAALRGLDYEIDGADRQRPLCATTFLDWKDATLSGDQPIEELVHCPSETPEYRRTHPSLVDFALASGANALGFAPRAVNRAGDAAKYGRVVNFPSSASYWYTDGGTLDNEPIGRTLDLVDDLDADGRPARRLLLLIHPHPTAGPHDQAWADPANPPTWIETLAKAQRLQMTQSIYDDLRHAEKTNRRIADLDRLAQSLADAVPAPVRASVDDALGAFLHELDVERARRGSARLAPRAADDATVKLLSDALHAAAGMTGKRRVGIEVLSPMLLPEAATTSVEDLLCGEFLLHFGGFAREALRQQDFDLGYRTVVAWFKEARPLERHGLGSDADDEALGALNTYTPPTWDAQLAKTGYKSLAPSERRSFHRLVFRALRIAWHDRRHPTHQ